MRISDVDDKFFTPHFADEQVIFAGNENDISHMVRKLDEEYEYIKKYEKKN